MHYIKAFQYDCNHVRQCCRRVENSVFPCVLPTGITWNEQHRLTCSKNMFVSLWHCDVSKDAMRKNVVPRTYYNLQVQLITVFESWGHPLMMRRKVKGLKDIWRGTPLPRSSMNQNDVNQVQVTKLSIQCTSDRPSCWHSKFLQGLAFLETFVHVCLLPLRHAPCVHQGQWMMRQPSQKRFKAWLQHTLIYSFGNLKADFDSFHVDQFCQILIVKRELCRAWMS